MKVLILYYSKTGHTLEAANAVAEGIRSAGSEADLVTVNDFRVSMLTDYEGLIVGSPCWAGSLTSDGVAKPISRTLKSLPSDCLKEKRCGGFAVHSMMGGETTLKSLGALLSQKRGENYHPGLVAKAGSTFSLWKGASITAEDDARFKTYGAEFVA